MVILRQFGIALLMLLLVSSSIAGITVSPVKLNLSTTDKIGLINATNTGQDSQEYQINLYEWTQNGNADVSSVPTTDLIAIPRITNIKPQASQAFRIGLVREPDSSKELTYRFVIIPIANAANEKPGTAAILVGFSVPVFVAPTGPIQKKLNWKIQQNSKGLLLSLTNAGNVHRVIKTVQVDAAASNSNKPLLDDKLAFYVLAGATHSWMLNNQLPKDAAVTITVTTAEGNMVENVRVV